MGPFLVAGEIVALRLTVPLKLFVPIIVTVTVADPPLAKAKPFGVAVIVKSGGEPTTTLTIVDTECTSFPLK